MSQHSSALPEPAVNTSRRLFLVNASTLAAGFTVGVAWPDARAQTLTKGHELGAWVSIQADNTVRIRFVRAEIGQGTMTGLAQLIADELDADWSLVLIDLPSGAENLSRKNIWGSGQTGASTGIRNSQLYCRKGGAAARAMLLEAASKRLNVPVAELSASNSVVTHQKSGQTATYASLALEASKLPVPENVVLKAPAAWKIIGKPIKRIETRSKITGSAEYGIDLQFPGMLISTIAACPVYSGKLKSFDAKKALAMPGVHSVMQVGTSAVAAVADTFWQAKKALDATVIEWDLGADAKVSSQSLRETRFKGLSATNEIYLGNQIGDLASAEKNAASQYQATYELPYLCHAQMEPMNATAIWTPDKCIAWAPSQGTALTFNSVVQNSGLPASKCEAFTTLSGGGFGRRLNMDFVSYVVLIAKTIPGRHIKLIWSREEDMSQGRYHPAMMAQITASIDTQNQLAGMNIRLSGESFRKRAGYPVVKQFNGVDPYVFEGLSESKTDLVNKVVNSSKSPTPLAYDFKNYKIDFSQFDSHIKLGPLRGTHAIHNIFAIECFMDELAHHLNMDALEFRLKHMMANPRQLNVLESVAQSIGWNQPKRPGIFKGLSQCTFQNSPTALACELSVSADKMVKVHRVVVAIDTGYAVNPALIERQIGGSVAWNLSGLFHEEITFKDGRAEQSNYDDYVCLKLSQMPQVDVTIIQGGGDTWGGAGEPATVLVAPAVVNALFRASGQRIRSAPLKNLGYALA